MDTVVAELVSFLEALKSGSPFHYLILLAIVADRFGTDVRCGSVPTARN